LCEKIDFPSYIKTSGSTGLHVLLPLGRQCTYDQSRQLAELIARAISEKLPDISTIIRPVGSRGGRVYLDYLQNGHGRTIASTFCVRPNPGATVSTPLNWSEVTAELDPKKFTIRTVVQRMEKLSEDPVLPVLEAKPDLALILERLDDELRKT